MDAIFIRKLQDFSSNFCLNFPDGIPRVLLDFSWNLFVHTAYLLNFVRGWKMLMLTPATSMTS